MKKASPQGKFRRKPRKTGLPPGSLVYTGEERTERVKITLFNYTSEGFIEKTVQSIEECLPYRDEKSVTWINIDGVHDTELIAKMGELFMFHPLLLEDVVNTSQRPKADDYDDHLYTVLPMLTYNESKHCIDSEQISIVLSKNFVVSFQQTEGDLFDVIRERIRDNKSKIRNYGNDYLVYRMIDVIVDHYFLLLEKIGDAVEMLEDRIRSQINGTIIEDTQKIKNDLLLLRRSVYPLREVLNSLVKDDHKLLAKRTQRFIRDVHDHSVQIMETLEMFREVVNGLREAYNSQLNMEMNKTIQTLTIMSVIFIPLSFIAGFYGMNFQHMPELEWKWGYPAVIAVMVAVSLGMVIFFRRKRWL